MVPSGMSGCYTDAGPDGSYWMTDTFDITCYAGQQYDVQIQAGGTTTGAGWAIDSMLVDWR